MKIALKEAEKAFDEEEVPIGCIIVKDDVVIARAHNRKETKRAAIWHAEIEAIKKASKKLDNWHLDDCIMYVTLEPCIMCAGAIVNSRIKKVYYAASDPKGGAFGSNMDITKIEKLNHYPEYEGGLLKDEAAALLRDFFKRRR